MSISLEILIKLVKSLYGILLKIWNNSLYFSILLFVISFAIRTPAFIWPSIPISDETYYVPASLSILESGEDPNYVHPPFGKYLFALTISFFGDNPLGWRFFSVFLGSLAVPMVYILGREIYGNMIGVIASFFLLIDPMAYKMSELAMLDIPLMFLILLGFMMLYWKKYELSAIVFGLSCAIKFVGAFAIIGAIVYLIISKKFNQIAKLIIIPMMIVFLLYIPIILNKGLSEWITEMFFVFNWHATLEAEHPAASGPFGWLFGITPFPVANGENPVLVSSNPFLYPLAIPFSIYMLYEYRKKEFDKSYILPIVWWLSTYVPFMLLPRKTQYIFYLLPSIPALLIIISYGLFIIIKQLILTD